MTTVDYDKAFELITKLYLKYGNRVEAEQKYLASLQVLEVPRDGELYKQHEHHASMYLARSTGVWEAMQILVKLKEEHEEMVRDKEDAACKMCGGDGERFAHEPKRCGYCDGTGKANAPQE